MRHSWRKRAGHDRVLMTLAVAFLTISASSALARDDNAPRNSAAELAIDAAVPRPEPANLPPPGPGDFKLDTVAPTDTPKAAATTVPEAPAAKPADVAAVPIRSEER